MMALRKSIWHNKPFFFLSNRLRSGSGYVLLMTIMFCSFCMYTVTNTVFIWIPHFYSIFYFHTVSKGVSLIVCPFRASKKIAWNRFTLMSCINLFHLLFHIPFYAIAHTYLLSSGVIFNLSFSCVHNVDIHTQRLINFAKLARTFYNNELQRCDRISYICIIQWTFRWYSTQDICVRCKYNWNRVTNKFRLDQLYWIKLFWQLSFWYAVEETAKIFSKFHSIVAVLFGVFPYTLYYIAWCATSSLTKIYRCWNVHILIPAEWLKV